MIFRFFNRINLADYIHKKLDSNSANIVKLRLYFTQRVGRKFAQLWN